jgi:hypothetical protein
MKAKAHDRQIFNDLHCKISGNVNVVKEEEKVGNNYKNVRDEWNTIPEQE